MKPLNFNIHRSKKGSAPAGVPERGTDIGALAEGYVSITLLHLDLTAYRALTDINIWGWEDAPDMRFFRAALEISEEPKL